MRDTVPFNLPEPDKTEAFRWLISGDGRQWLDRIAAEPHIMARSYRVGRELSVARSRMIAEQLRLRARAEKKFPGSAQMFFTPRGLAQATDDVIGRYKAARFPHGQPVADICCGIGGDLIALGRRGPVIGFDRDPTAVLLATVNCLGDPEIDRFQVQCADAAHVPVRDFAAWHIDPDRRVGERRTTNVDQSDPGQSDIELLLQCNGNLAIKLAPAATIPPAWRQRAEWEWIGHRRECQQLVGWFGEFAKHPGQRIATRLFADARSASFTGPPDVPLQSCAEVSGLGEYLFEPHPSVLAARLAGALADHYGLTAITPGGGYLSGTRLLPEEMMSCYCCLDVVPFREKRIRQMLQSYNVGRLEVKKRNADVSPAVLQRRLSGAGENAAVLFVTHVGRSLVAILARRDDGG